MKVADDCEFIKPGDIVIYGKYSGTPIELETADGKKETLVIIEEKQILAYSRQDEVDE